MITKRKRKGNPKNPDISYCGTCGTSCGKSSDSENYICLGCAVKKYYPIFGMGFSCGRQIVSGYPKD